MLKILLIASSLAFCVTAQAIPEGPAYPSLEWTLRETANYAKTVEAPVEQATSLNFLLRLEQQSVANQLSWTARALADPSWLLSPSGNSPVTPLCSTWMQQCAGDPFRYAQASGPDGASFYANEADVRPVVFYDRGCARISGRVWAPKGSKAGDRLPNVVIETGSIQAPETLYWWFAQALVRAGYVVLTFDVRGQGRSDQQTPSAVQGGNANSAVFWEGLVDAIDFFRSSAARPYPHNLACVGSYPTAVTAFNPFRSRLDPARLGIAGHSLGASGVSIVQSYGAVGADPWPGLMDRENPVKVTIAWDRLGTPGGSGATRVVPRTPALGFTSEYGIAGLAMLQPPDPEGHKNAYKAWAAGGVPVMNLTIAGSTHFDFSLIPTFPATSWCPDTRSGECRGGWGLPLVQHYSLAWMDRWLKKPGERGYANADARLLDDAGAQGARKLSFYSRSARAYTDRANRAQVCGDIRAGCAP